MTEPASQPDAEGPEPNDPSLGEIQEACLLIRDSWDEATETQRAHGKYHPATPQPPAKMAMASANFSGVQEPHGGE